MSVSAPARRLLVLGSTGSIGRNVLEVVEHLNRLGPSRFQIVGLAAGSSAEQLSEQGRRFAEARLALAGEAGGTGVAIEGALCGPSAAEDLVRETARPGDLVVAAMVGAAGIPAVIAAIEAGCDIALANKETLVAAGQIVVPLARETGVELIPIDSEHSAIAQCLRSGRSIDEVRRLVITASGGPFRTWTAEQLSQATVEDALNHPTWQMGRKITIDSATLMNKALEMIEAHWLFGLEADRIDVIVHPQSLVHSFVEFVDGSIIAQLSPPDMRLPIQYALTSPQRHDGLARRLDWDALSRLDFEPVDHERFPSIGLAAEVISRGGSSGAILNAANEVAVEAFLGDELAFSGITTLVAQALAGVPMQPVKGVQTVLAADQTARAFVQDRIALDDSRAASARVVGD